MRLIDADALIKSIEQSKGKNSIYAQFVRAYTKDAPTIDQVRHGRWIESTTDLICSSCETVFNDEIAWMCRDYTFGYPKYCPYCGAKMDEEEKHGQK